jgi:cytochrome c peroxidase
LIEPISRLYDRFVPKTSLVLLPAVVAAVLANGALGCSAAGPEDEGEALGQEQQPLLEEYIDSLPNNFPIPNEHGLAASFSTTTAPIVSLNNNFFTPQGTNGRDCGTCHAAEDGWSLRPATVTLMFLLSDGLDPLFVNHLDTDTPTCDMSTTQARWDCTTMLRQGLFTRRVSPPATRDYDVIAANDPLGVGTTASLWFFRRPLPTANFKSHTVMWDAANTVGTSLRDGLIRQARGNVTGAQQGAPASDAVIFDMVDYEAGIGHAQRHALGAGSLTAGGAMGGPENAIAQPLVNARFDLFDAWQDSQNPHRQRIYRGQEIFNNPNVASGRTCRGCHNAANNGQNVNGTLFDVGVSRPQFGPGKAVYTFQHRTSGAIVESTDPGRGIRNGVFADLNKFKTPNIRGLASRAPYFHNGIAADIPAIIDHYEVALGFDFTDHEEVDLAAFLAAL